MRCPAISGVVPKEGGELRKACPQLRNDDWVSPDKKSGLGWGGEKEEEGEEKRRTSLPQGWRGETDISFRREGRKRKAISLDGGEGGGKGGGGKRGGGGKKKGEEEKRKGHFTSRFSRGGGGGGGEGRRSGQRLWRGHKGQAKPQAEGEVKIYLDFGRGKKGRGTWAPQIVHEVRGKGKKKKQLAGWEEKEGEGGVGMISIRGGIRGGKTRLLHSVGKRGEKKTHYNRKEGKESAETSKGGTLHVARKKSHQKEREEGATRLVRKKNSHGGGGGDFWRGFDRKGEKRRRRRED